MILASQSPRRRELLKLITEDFTVIPATSKEKKLDGVKPKDLAMGLARHKAVEVANSHFGEMVIGADTIVVIDGEILGKPHDKWEAVEMLRKLSGRCHSVYTGVWIVYEDRRQLGFVEDTDVEFYLLTNEQIMEYVESGEPMDKAGAYGIQERGALFVKQIRGDYYNVMGLPVGRLNHILQNGG